MKNIKNINIFQPVDKSLQEVWEIKERVSKELVQNFAELNPPDFA